VSGPARPARVTLHDVALLHDEVSENLHDVRLLHDEVKVSLDDGRLLHDARNKVLHDAAAEFLHDFDEQTATGLQPFCCSQSWQQTQHVPVWYPGAPIEDVLAEGQWPA
jgi:hypothetical protein